MPERKTYFCNVLILEINISKRIKYKNRKQTYLKIKEIERDTKM